MRPIRQRIVKTLPRPRLPPREPLTPGLRQADDAGQLVDAIGFHTFSIASTDDETEDRRRARRRTR